MHYSINQVLIKYLFKKCVDLCSYSLYKDDAELSFRHALSPTQWLMQLWPLMCRQPPKHYVQTHIFLGQNSEP